MRAALHVGQLRQRVPGGIGRYVERLARHLPEAGVDLLTFAAGAVDAPAGTRLPALTDLGRPYDGVRYELWHRLRAPRLPFSADVVHAPSLAVPPPGDAALVVTIHDLAFIDHSDSFTRRGVAFHSRGLEVAEREADAIVTASEFVRRQLVRRGIDESRIHVAPHGVTLHPTLDETEALRRVEALGVRPPFILQVGTVEPRKGIENLIAALPRVRRAIPDVTLVLAGPIGWGQVAGLREAGVVALGHVEDAALEGLYREAMLATVASRSEGFGLPALEAMAHGTPLIASDATSLPEVVADAGILVPPDHPAAWSRAIIDIARDDAARADLAARGRDRAATFTWAASGAAHRVAYEQALAHPAPQRRRRS
ncbi:MAG: glycosyltransferase family 4 protein [Actinomycetes bacterium]